MLLDEQGYSSRLLNKAWKSAKNEDIAADIISYIRTHAVGSSLISHEDRIKKAIKTIRDQREWTKTQSNWLDRFEKKLIAESILNKEDLDSGSFKDKGGFKTINKVFDNQLESIIKTINENLYNQSA